MQRHGDRSGGGGRGRTERHGGLLALSPKAHAALRAHQASRARRGALAAQPDGGVSAGGEDLLVGLAPRRERAPGLGGFAEDEAEEHVEAGDGEEEEGGDEREFVYVMREHCCSDPVE